MPKNIFFKDLLRYSSTIRTQSKPIYIWASLLSGHFCLGQKPNLPIILKFYKKLGLFLAPEKTYEKIFIQIEWKFDHFFALRKQRFSIRFSRVCPDTFGAHCTFFETNYTVGQPWLHWHWLPHTSYPYGRHWLPRHLLPGSGYLSIFVKRHQQFF